MIAAIAHPPIDLSLDVAIDPQDPQNAAMLDNLQGNILKSHGRDHVTLLTLRFTTEAAMVRNWLRSFAAHWLTSASEQRQDASTYRRGGATGVFGSIFLTAAGYQKLGLTRQEMLSRFGGEGEKAAFTSGMAAARQALNDPAATTWDLPYREATPIDAMVLLAADSPHLLEWSSGRVERSLEGVGVVAGRENGAVLRDAQDRTIEPFGFADGLSQPVFFKDDLDHMAETQGGVDVWNPSAPLSLALVADPFAAEPDCFGSFLVFRKLEQNVKRFRERLQQVAQQYTGGDEDLAGAFLVGRFKNGTPVISYRQSASGSGGDFNNFKYRRDVSGSRCPFHAHIGKTNPRERSVGVTSHNILEERTHRIVRRGIPYDDREVRDGDAEAGVGLLFLCFQADITKQFAFIQESWANSPDFPRPASGMDPLVGRATLGQTPDQQWPTAWDGESDSQRHGDFGQFVTLKGGEFFFAPSIPFLKGL
jgi:Dyp-type peroxidase family